jgi:hypothetical protein
MKKLYPKNLLSFTRNPNFLCDKNGRIDKHYVWIDSKGNEHKIIEMTDKKINNLINLINGGDCRMEYLDIFEHELKYRKTQLRKEKLERIL